MEFLGFAIDTERQTVSILKEKYEKFCEDIELLKSKKEVDVKSLEKIRGKACSFMLVIQNARLVWIQIYNL